MINLIHDKLREMPIQNSNDLVNSHYLAKKRVKILISIQYH